MPTNSVNLANPTGNVSRSNDYLRQHKKPKTCPIKRVFGNQPKSGKLERIGRADAYKKDGSAALEQRRGRCD